MSLTIANTINVVNTTLNNIAFFDLNFINGLTSNTTYYLDTPSLYNSFKSLPPFDIKFNILAKQFKLSGRLVYEYNPFHNLILANPTSLTTEQQTFYFQTGDVCDFNISGSLLPFDLNHPLEMEIQPSYDGSVNVIVLDDLNQAVLVNSRFSPEELDTYRIIDRRGSNDTNLYEENYLQSQTKLYKTSNVISQLSLQNIETGGKMLLGSYVFYFKYADLDGNETDIIAESGIVSCYIGNTKDPKSIRGGIQNEITDKLVKLKIKYVDKAYDYINIYYVRTTSDYSEVTTQSLFKILEKYIVNTNTIVNDEIIITVSGYESVLEITIDELLQSYNIIDRQKSIAQIQNRLFQANLTQDTNEYKDLEDLALRFYPTIRQKQNIGDLNHNYEINPLNPGLEYYDPINIHDYLGYWNKEIYRTGIVFIYSDNRLSPVFSTRGGQNIGELNLDDLTASVNGLLDYKNRIQTGGNIENAKTCYSFFELYDNDGKRNYITTTENKEVINPSGNKTNENSAGVFNIMHSKGPITQLGVQPLAIQFSTTKDVLEYLNSIGVKGFFFVRQKRIPTILFQGITQGLSTNLCLPLLFTQDYAQKAAHRTEFISYPEVLGSTAPTIYTASVKIDGVDGTATRVSFNSGDVLNILSNDKTLFDKRFAVLKEGNYKQSGTIFSPDITLNTELMSDLLVGNELVYSKCFHKLVNNALKQAYTYEPSTSVTIPSRHFYAEGISNEVNRNLFTLKVTLVEDGNPLKFSGTQRFRGLAGIQEEAFRFESTELITLDSGIEVPNPDYAIRGVYSTYAGLEHAEFLPSGTLIDVHVPNYAYENLSKYFEVRRNSFQSYYAITHKFDLSRILEELTKKEELVWHIELYRGDCFVGNYSQRINRNFQDAELPLNDTILGNMINTEFNYTNSMYNLSTWFSLCNDTVNKNGIPFVEDNYQLVNRLDVNAVQLGHWLTFKTCSNHNICYRTIDKQYSEEYALTGTYRTFFPFSKISWTSENKIAESSIINKGYSTTLPTKSYFINPEVPFIQDKFNNRIMFSEIHVNNSFKNGYRVFKGLNYKDYNVGYGSITKILEWKNNILVVFEHGIGIIPVNESLLLADGKNTGSIYVRGADVLPPTINTISDMYGSQWKDSIIKSSRYVYGIDHVAKKIWRTDGESIELISDFKIQSFLNQNITLNSREKTPTVGIRNIKTHYNAFKEDIMFTYYDVDSVLDEKKWNMCYNEQLSRWITRYDWEPLMSQNINNIYFSYDRESPENLLFLASSYYNSKSSNGITVTNYEILDPNNPDNTNYLEPNTNTILLDYRPILQLKSHVLEQYYPDYFIDLNDGYDNAYFKIVTTAVYNPNNPSVPIIKKEIAINSLPEGTVTIEQLVLLEKFLFSIRVKAIMYKKNGDVWDTVWDTIHIRLDRNFYDDTSLTLDENNLTQRDRYDRAYMTRFWKHGQAGIFDYVGEIKPTTWYAKTRPFEFEFIMLDQPGLHKILDNLLIISNNVAPESFEFVVTTDSYTLLELPYDIAPTLTQYVLNRRGLDTSTDLADNYILTTVTNETVKLTQKAFDTWKVGRLFGNMHYKEDFWYIDVLPIQIYQKVNAASQLVKGKQSKIKDKLIKIRVKYDGKDLAVITLLNSLYSQTYS